MFVFLFLPSIAWRLCKVIVILHCRISFAEIPSQYIGIAQYKLKSMYFIKPATLHWNIPQLQLIC